MSHAPSLLVWWHECRLADVFNMDTNRLSKKIISMLVIQDVISWVIENYGILNTTTVSHQHSLSLLACQLLGLEAEQNEGFSLDVHTLAQEGRSIYSLVPSESADWSQEYISCTKLETPISEAPWISQYVQRHSTCEYMKRLTLILIFKDIHWIKHS